MSGVHVPLAPFASTVAGSAVQQSRVLYVCIRFVWGLEYCVVLLRTCAGTTAGLRGYADRALSSPPMLKNGFEARCGPASNDGSP